VLVVILSLDQTMKSFRELRVRHASMDLVEEIYRVTRAFPNDERFAMTIQIQRAAVSIPPNIAEGHTREHSESICIIFQSRKLPWPKSKRNLKLRLDLVTSRRPSAKLFWRQQVRWANSFTPCEIACRARIRHLSPETRYLSCVSYSLSCSTRCSQ
jgi:hypothetical protein